MQTIEAPRLKTMMTRSAGPVVVDTLSPDNYQSEHIPGAQNIPGKDDRFVERVEQLVRTRDEPVVVYCAGKSCDLSPAAAKKLEDAGFTNVIDFEGGIDEWKRAGFKLESGPSRSPRA